MLTPIIREKKIARLVLITNADYILFRAAAAADNRSFSSWAVQVMRLAISKAKKGEKL